MDRDPAAPPAGWVALPPRQRWRLLSFLGFLVTASYSFLIIDAVDQMRSASPSASYSAEHEQLLGYYMAWSLGLLAMLLPAMLADSPRLMRMEVMAMNFLLLPMAFQEFE